MELPRSRNTDIAARHFTFRDRAIASRRAIRASLLQLFSACAIAQPLAVDTTLMTLSAARDDVNKIITYALSGLSFPYLSKREVHSPSPLASLLMHVDAYQARLACASAHRQRESTLHASARRRRHAARSRRHVGLSSLDVHNAPVPIDARATFRCSPY